MGSSFFALGRQLEQGCRRAIYDNKKSRAATSMSAHIEYATPYKELPLSILILLYAYILRLSTTLL